MVNIIGLVLIGGFFFFLIVGVILMVMMMSWNIPVTILRFTGNKQRPMIIHRKARKQMVKGTPRLWVRGYKTPVRDFKAENYYPSPKTKWGGLILWEFEDGWLTPVVPKKVKLTPDQEEVFRKAAQELNSGHVVNFEYDREIHDRLLLKIVDDVDAEFAVEQLFRQENQYSGGFWDFLNRHSTSIMAVIVVVCLLAGFVVWLDKSPQMMAECASVAKSTILESITREGSGALVPPA